jgi:hypothetical protein
MSWTEKVAGFVNLYRGQTHGIVTNYSEQEFEWQFLNIRAFESR